MLRSLLLAMLTLGMLLPTSGCHKATPQQPRLANPDDPRVQGLQPAGRAGGADANSLKAR